MTPARVCNFARPDRPRVRRDDDPESAVTTPSGVSGTADERRWRACVERVPSSMRTQSSSSTLHSSAPPGAPTARIAPRRKLRTLPARMNVGAGTAAAAPRPDQLLERGDPGSRQVAVAPVPNPRLGPATSSSRGDRRSRTRASDPSARRRRRRAELVDDNLAGAGKLERPLVTARLARGCPARPTTSGRKLTRHGPTRTPRRGCPPEARRRRHNELTLLDADRRPEPLRSRGP